MEKKLGNWGNYPMIDCEYLETRENHLMEGFIKDNENIIARGNGRCYGDSALAENVVSALRLNKILALDTEQGIITCEAGVLLSEILDVSIPKGYFLYVTPGTKLITVGGAIGSDVHGKSHHCDGCFSRYLISFDLMLETGDVVSVKPGDELFKLTCGGMGLTGVILRATFKLRPIESSYLSQHDYKAANLTEILDLFEETADYTFSVAWIDCLKGGNGFGRSILNCGEHATLDELPEKHKSDPLTNPSKKTLSIPFDFPSFSLNKFSVKAFNMAFYGKTLKKQSHHIGDYNSFFYPLDALLHWNRIYGKNGFTQYQFVIPTEAGREGLDKILNEIRKSGEASFLSVLKRFGKKEQNTYISFPFEGYTLALDFRINKKVLDLLDRLDPMVLDYGGRHYMTKDVRMTAETLEKGYGKDLEIFKEKLEPYRKYNKFNSLQTKRLGL